MGIDLGDVVVKRPRLLADYSGKVLAMDAWNMLYQFLASIRQPDGSPLTDANGHITSHLQGLLARSTALLEAGIKPVFVFDGKPHPLKLDTLTQRASRKEQAQVDYEAALEAGDLATARIKAQQTSRLTAPMVDEAKQLLAALGLPVVQAPGEGEALACVLAQRGLVDAVVSQDYDAVLFGAPVLVRNLGVGGRRKVPGKQVWMDTPPEEIRLDETLGHLGLRREQLVDAALLVGTDFHPGIKGIGAKKAIALVAKHGSLEAVRAAVEAGTETSAAGKAIMQQQDALTDAEEIKRIFLVPDATDVGADDLRPSPVQVEAARRLLVDTHGFAWDRVQASLDRIQATRSKQAQTRLF